MLRTDPDFGGVSLCSTPRGDSRAFTRPYLICHSADGPLNPGDHDEEK